MSTPTTLASAARAAGIPTITFYAADATTPISARDVQDMPAGATYYWQAGAGAKIKASRGP